MNPRFKPLLTPPAESTGSQSGFALKILPAGTVAEPFKPLSSMLPAVAGGEEPHDHAAPSDEAGAVPPALDVRREGERVVRINLTCNCGRLHEIDCSY